jgi:RNA-directed DNA polymerase
MTAATDVGLVGATIADRYELVELLGRGGMGDVYRALDRELDDAVALKIVRDEVARIPGVLARFRAEVKLARRVTHNNVARTFELGHADGLTFFTMELVQGVSLADRLTRGAIPVGEALAIAAALCDALAAAHAVGVIHRDLKPANVLLADDGRVVLTDFGVATLVAADDVVSSGTPRYMAPEQARGEAATPAVDVYALGLVLYEMVTGTPAFVGGVGTVLDAKQDPSWAPTGLAAIEPGLRAIIARAIAVAPAERWPDVGRLAQALGADPQVASSGASRVGAASGRDLPTAVILPPRADGDAGYLIYGLQDELLRRLSRRARLRLLRRGQPEGTPGVVNVELAGGERATITAWVAGRADVVTVAAPLEVDALVAAAELASRLVATTVGAGAERGVDDPPLPAAARGLLWRGRDLGRIDGVSRLAAHAEFAAAAALAPRDPRIMAGLAIGEVRAAFFSEPTDPQQMVRAEAYATAAITAAPHEAEAQLAYGRVRFHSGDAVAAAGHFRAATMVRRDDAKRPQGPDASCCASPTGASPVPVSVGAPGSRPPARGEIPGAEARRQEPREGEQERGPQHEVKPAASTDKQWGSRAAHVTAKATRDDRVPKRSARPSGVRGAARVQGEARNTGDPSASPPSGQGASHKLKVKASVAQRKSEGIVVPTRPAPQNAGGGKGPWGGHDGASRRHKGMIAERGLGNPSRRRSNSPDRQSTVDHVQRLQRRLGEAAKRAPTRRFHALYDRIWRADILREAWKRVQRNGGSAGIDEESIAAIRALGEDAFVADLGERLRAGRYRPQAVRRCWIPKANGGRRPLGIPTVRDRVVQAATKLVLEPIFEVDFQDCSYGFRPGRNATQALEVLRVRGARGGNHVLDADIADFFGSLDREVLMKRLMRRISDRRVLRLIRMWLDAGVIEEGREIAMLSGVPQGGVISPLLSNIYLAFLDERWTKQCADLGTLVRYADDFVIMCDTRAKVDEAERRVKIIFQRLKLKLHPEKTRKVEIAGGKAGFDFLGCHLRKRMSGPIWAAEKKRRYFLQRWPSTKSMKRVRQRVKELTPRAAQHRDLRETIAKLNPVLRGWGGYFRTGNAARKFNQIDGYVWQRLRSLVRKRKGRNLRPGEMARWTRDEFVRLGLHRLRGTVRYPGARPMPPPDRPPVSRVREIRTHGLNGGLVETRRKAGES